MPAPKSLTSGASEGRKQTAALWASVGVWLFSLTVYVLTLLPTVGASGDTPKFQFISAILGIPHPSGYPLYILLGRVFSWLPVANVAWRMDFMSAFFAASTVFVLFWTALALTRNVLLSAASSLAWAFAGLFWSQSVIAEVYTLNALFVISVILFLILWEKRRQQRFLHLAMVLYALGFGNHLSMLFLLPAWIYWVWCVDRQVFTDRRTIGVGLSSVIAGASPYAYILIRARQRPPHCESCPDTLARLLNYLFRPMTEGTSFNFELFRHPAERLLHSADLLQGQFYWWGILLIVLGVVILWLRDRKTAVFLLTAVLCLVMWPLNYVPHIIVFYIPVFLVLALFVAVGAAAGVDYLAEHAWARVRGLPKVVGWALAALLVCWPLNRNWWAQDQSQNRAAERLCQAVFDPLEPGSVVYSSDRGLRYALSYWHYVQRPQLEVEVTSRGDALRSAFGRRAIHTVGADARILETYVLDPPPIERLSAMLRRVPEGAIVAIVAKDEASYGLSGEDVAALRTVGGSVDLRGCWRCGYILVGVKGAEEGTAFEVSGYRRLWSKHFWEGEWIGGTGVRMPVSLLARSAGLDAGNVGDLIVDGVSVSPLGRGLNIAVIDPETGAVLQTTNRDTAVGSQVDGAGLYRVVGRREGDIIIPADPSRLDYWQVPWDGIDFGDPDSRRYMGVGWGVVEDWGTWSDGPESTLHVLIPPDAGRVELTAMPFAIQGLAQAVELCVNEASCQTVRFEGEQVQSLVFQVPPQADPEGVDRLDFRFAYAKSPHEVSGTPDMRNLGVWFVRLRFSP
ncbi:MAG: DUF2723 domain-containing protein [Anaerolineae bacterium]|nr:DUF2723 domain-containing protein [Anaerolineae bacterium]